MNRFLVITVLAAIIFAVAGPVYANVLFFDNFDDNTFDTDKWGVALHQSSGAPASTVTESNGRLDFKLWGGSSGGNIYAYSKNAAPSYGWSQIDFTGKWQQTGVRDTAGAGIVIYDANNTSKYLSASYSPYWRRITFYDSGTLRGTYNRDRDLPEQQFALSFTPMGWSFVDGGTTYLNNVASTSLANATSFKIKIGGDEAAYYPNNNEHNYFDEILLQDDLVSTVPEPASMALVGVGLTGLLALRRRKRG